MGKRILIVCARIPYPIVDGGAHAIYTLLKALSIQGHQLFIVSYDSSKHLQNSDGIKEFGNVITHKKTNADYRFYDLLKSLWLKKPASIFARFDDQIFEKMLKEIISVPFDTILYAGLQTCAHLDFLKKQYPNAEHILYQVNIEHLLYQRIAQAQNEVFRQWAYEKQAEYMQNFEYTSLSQVDKILFISSKDETYFKTELKQLNSISLLPPSLKQPTKTQTTQLTGNLCAFSNWDWAPNYQGLDWFLDHVWPILKMKEPKIELHLAGRNMSQQQQKRVKQTDGVKYLGFVDNLQGFMANSSVMVAPLISGSGIKIKIIEALAHALPFVTTNIGFEGFEDSFLMNTSVADKPIEFANKLLKLKNNSDLNNQVRAYMFEFAKSKLQLASYAEDLNAFVYN